jgi:hypothetical protein
MKRAVTRTLNAADVGNLATSDRPHLGSLERRNSHRLAIKRHELDLVTVLPVNQHHSTDVAHLEPEVELEKLGIANLLLDVRIVVP